MTLTEARQKNNKGNVYFNMFGDMHTLTKRKLKVGDKVRISTYKRKTFDKGYTLNWK